MSSQVFAKSDIFPVSRLPLALEPVVAGFPSPAQDFVEKSLDLNELCVRHPAATFFVRAAGDSMIEAGIFPGDILIVDKSLQPGHGDIVIAVVDGEFTVKELALRPAPTLIARSANHPPIRLGCESELEVFGVVIHSIRDFRSKR